MEEHLKTGVCHKEETRANISHAATLLTGLIYFQHFKGRLDDHDTEVLAHYDVSALPISETACFNATKYVLPSSWWNPRHNMSSSWESR